MAFLDVVHGRWVFHRRVAQLCRLLSSLLPMSARVLDVGAGDGSLDRALLHLRPDLQITGLDVLVRPQTAIPVLEFDGVSLPFENGGYDVVMFIDVLHHTRHGATLIKEARRVGRAVILKDHLREGFLSGPTLRFMDFVGNARFGVHLPYNYWTQQEWDSAFSNAGLRSSVWISDLNLYPPPLTWLFDRRLHFLAHLQTV